jgi:hypothetical protein
LHLLEDDDGGTRHTILSLLDFTSTTGGHRMVREEGGDI